MEVTAVTNQLAYETIKLITALKSFYRPGISGKFHKHVTRITYDPGKISCKVLPLYALPAGCMICSVFQNALVYFATALSYVRNMLLKLTPVANDTKLFTAVSYDFS
jgi:hypothetical protein